MSKTQDQSGRILERTDLSVGEILRRSRINMGLSLQEVSDALRIQTRHLESLETGEWDRLPGKVYIIGFVRTYAEYLGLDGEKMIRLLKMQSEGFTQLKPRLSFPKTPGESRVPGWKSFVVALVIFAGTVSIWQYNSGTAPYLLPDYLTSPLSDQLSSMEDGTLEIRYQETEPPVLDPDIHSNIIEDKLSEIKSLDKSKVELSPQSSRHNAAEKDIVSFSGQSTQSQKETSKSPGDIQKSESLKASAEKRLDMIKEQSTVVDNAKNLSVTEARQGAGSSERPAADTGAGLKLVSVYASWVQIKDENDEVVFAQVLRPGDVYQIPPKSDKLVLSTGNAGGLKVMRGGRELGFLGKQGDIIRGIYLNRQALQRYIIKPEEE